MRKVFISSTVTEFEKYRDSAKQAVELMGDKPIMCEDFGARSYSSEKACITEVENCDVYVIILGAKYGFITPEGISVTETEFNTALKTGKPVLAFTQKVEMGELQSKLRERVEDYTGGFFRETFNTAEQLKDGIIKGLRQLNQFENSATEKDFKIRLESAVSDFGQLLSYREPEMQIAFWPQPNQEIDIIKIEDGLDKIFERACHLGLLEYRDGYKEILEKNFTGLESGNTKIVYFHDSLTVVLTNPVIKGNTYTFGNYFAPPSRIKELALKIFNIWDSNAGWCNIEFREMEHIKVHELPKENVNSISMGFGGDKTAQFNHLFIPLTEASYAQWIEICIGRLKRIFK